MRPVTRAPGVNGPVLAAAACSLWPGVGPGVLPVKTQSVVVGHDTTAGSMFRSLTMSVHTATAVERGAELVEISRELAHAAVIVAANANATKALNGSRIFGFLTWRPDRDWLSKIDTPLSPTKG